MLQFHYLGIGLQQKKYSHVSKNSHPKALSNPEQGHWHGPENRLSTHTVTIPLGFYLFNEFGYDNILRSPFPKGNVGGIHTKATGLISNTIKLN